MRLMEDSPAERAAQRKAHRAAKALDKAIADAYYPAAQGRQISILDIPKFYAEVRAAVAAGGNLEAAVAAGVAKFTQVA